MTAVRPLPDAGCTIDDLAREINAMHACLHAVRREASLDRKLAADREALRRERHESIKEDLGDIGRRVGLVERWQESFALSFGMRPPDEGRAPKRIFGLSYAVVLGWFVALLIGMTTGPVGYFVLLKMLPAAVHAALSVAP
jgi:hypothetical protein